VNHFAFVMFLARFGPPHKKFQDTEKGAQSHQIHRKFIGLCETAGKRAQSVSCEKGDLARTAAGQQCSAFREGGHGCNLTSNTAIWD
jgi:hypothetical protein